MRDTQDTAGMRSHGWQLLGTVGKLDDSGKPAFLSWPRDRDVVASPDLAPRGIEPLRRASTLSTAPRRGVVSRPATAVTVHFSPVAAEHIRANRFGVRSTYADLQTKFGGSNAATETRRITEFPAESMAVKAIWRIIPGDRTADERWAIPTWDEGARDATASYPPGKWERSVIIDFDEKEAATPGNSSEAKAVASQSVSLNRFLWMKLDPAGAAMMSAKEGDIAILVGLHIATKELPGWVWATYWWSDSPDAGQFAASRPSALPAILAHYLMDIDFGPAAGTPAGQPRRAIFNPYLEAGMKRGIGSNCISCHQQASLTESLHTAPFAPIRQSLLPESDPAFSGRIRTDFVWSLAKVKEPNEAE